MRHQKSTPSSSAPRPTQRFDVILHEVFGMLASSEGCAATLAHAREYYFDPRPGAISNPVSTFLPARAGTFLTLCEVLPAALDCIDPLFVSHKLVLGHALPLSTLALSETSRRLEYFEFNLPRPFTNQSYTHTFAVVTELVFFCYYLLS